MPPEVGAKPLKNVEGQGGGRGDRQQAEPLIRGLGMGAGCSAPTEPSALGPTVTQAWKTVAELS